LRIDQARRALFMRNARLGSATRAAFFHVLRIKLHPRQTVPAETSHLGRNQCPRGCIRHGSRSAGTRQCSRDKLRQFIDRKFISHARLVR
jgi:hypothetical protein